MSQASANPVKDTVLIGSTQTITFQADWRSDHPAGRDIRVQFSVEPSLADSFNTNHKTSYPVMPKNSYELTQKNAIIPIGKWSTKKLKLEIMAKGNIKASTKYLLPVSIKTNGVRVDTTLKTTYFLIQGENP